MNLNTSSNSEIESEEVTKTLQDLAINVHQADKELKNFKSSLFEYDLYKTQDPNITSRDLRHFNRLNNDTKIEVQAVTRRTMATVESLTTDMETMKISITSLNNGMAELVSLLPVLKIIANKFKAETEAHGSEDNGENTNNNNSNGGGTNGGDRRTLNDSARIPKLECPKFYGKNDENVVVWLNLMERNLDAAEIQAERRIKIAALYLRDGVSEAYERWKSTGQLGSWDQFKAKLRKEYLPENYEQVLLRQYLSLKMNSSTLKSHVEKLDKILTQFERNSVSENVKVLGFTDSLPVTMQEFVRQKKPKTLEEAINYAFDFENARAMQGGKPNEVNQFEARNIRTNRFDANKNKNGRRWHDRGTFNQPRQQFQKKWRPREERKDKWCSFCGDTDHSIENCPKANPGMNKNRAIMSKNSVNMAVINELDHSNATLEDDDFTVTTALVNNLEVEVLFDTGAIRSIIPINFVKKFNIPLKSQLHRCTMANMDSSLVEVTEKLEVKLHGTVTQMEFFVLNRRNVLLGVDWLNANKAYIRTFDKALVFGEREIFLRPAEENGDNIDIDAVTINNACLSEHEAYGDEEWDFESNDRILKSKIVDETLSQAQNETLYKLIMEFKDIFATSIGDLHTPCTIAKHIIKLEDTKPIRIKPYRRSIKEKELIQKDIDEMLRAGIIRKSKSPWASPALLVDKHDGSKRFCVDYRQVNHRTIQDPFPMPRIDDIFDRLNGALWFSSLDLKSGYWQILVDENSIVITAFSTTEGHYEFIRLPFGLKNAPGDFSRIMQQVVEDLKFLDYYLDDLYVFSTSFEEQIKHLRSLFTRIRETSLKINLAKCKWFRREIKVLGHWIGNHQIKMDLEKIQVVKEWKQPTKVVQVQQFLGLCGYYRKFIENFAKLAAPLYKITRNDVKFEWSIECQEAFEILKSKLLSYPILRQPDFKKPFIVHTDACGVAIGAILAQIDENGHEYVCIYSSRLLKGAELNYGITEKECLAVLWGVSLYRVYVYGQRFKIVTDHSALLWLLKIKNAEGRLAKWANTLQVYTFDIIHRAGKAHTNADAVSRALLNVEISIQGIANDKVEIEEISAKKVDVWEDDIFLHYLITGKYLPGSSGKQCRRIKKLAKFYVFNNDKLWFFPNIDDKQSKLLVPRKEDRADLIKEAHCLGHFALEKTYKDLKTKYYWKGMWVDCEFELKNCMTCLRYQKTPIQDHPALALPISGLFDRLGMDLILGLPKTDEDFVGILVITEYLTKYPYAVPIKSKSATEIARHLFNYISLFGPPKEILSDQGKEFLNSVVDSMLKQSGVEHIVTAAYNPRTNGHTERFGETLIPALSKHAQENPLDWDKWLPFVLLAYRTRIHSTSKYTPFELMFGRKINSFANWKNNLNESDEASIIKRSVEIRTQVEETVPQVIETIKEAQLHQKRHQNEQHRIRKESIVKGTMVMLEIPGIRNKLEPKYRGPYEIEKQLPNGNYQLLNKYKKMLSSSYPLSKLKIAEIDKRKLDEDIYDVEEIKKHRVRNGLREYFVKWKGFPESSCTWEPESSFISPQILEDYHNEKEKRASTNWINPNRNKLNVVNALICFFVVIVGLQSISGLEIRDSFKFCTTNANSRRLDPNHMCEKFETHENVVQGKFWILKRSIYPIDGQGFKCLIDKVLVKTYVNFFGVKEVWRTVEPQEVSKEECLAMVISKSYNKQNFTCVNDHCKSLVEPKVDFGWLSERLFVAYNCHFYKVLIRASSLNNVLFNNAKSSCLAIDESCTTEEGVYIWDTSIIHSCPYFKVKEIILNVSENIATSGNLLFQLTSKSYECEMEIVATTEGLFLVRTTNSSDLVNHNVKGEVDLDIDRYLVLAEMDAREFNLYKLLNKFRIQGDAQVCNSLSNALKLFAESQNEYFRFKYGIKKELIIYNSNGILLLPTCIDVESVTIRNTSDCFRDIPVELYQANKTLRSFLTNDGVLKLSSESRPCSIKTSVYLKRGDLVTRIGETIRLEKASIQYVQVDELNFSIENLNFMHDSELLTNFDLTAKVAEVNDLGVNDEFKNTIVTSLNKSLSLAKIGSKLAELSRMASEKIKYIVYCGAAALVVITILVLTCIYLKYRKPKEINAYSSLIKESPSQNNSSKQFNDSAYYNVNQERVATTKSEYKDWAKLIRDEMQDSK